MITRIEENIGGRPLKLETGLLAQQASGAVVVSQGETMVLVAATGLEVPSRPVDFFPLLVDFEEKLYAAGKIPGGFFKREGRPSEKAILISRLIDRPIRPLFPDNYRCDVQIVVTTLSVDQENLPDVLSIVGASAALTISGIPYFEPIGAVRVGRVAGQYLINPTTADIAASDLDLVVAATRDKVLMLEGAAREVGEDVVMGAIKAAMPEIRRIIDLQHQFKKQVGERQKVKGVVYDIPEVVAKKVKEAMPQIEKIYQETDRDQREIKLDELKAKIKEDLEKKDAETAKLMSEDKAAIPAAFKKAEKETVRRMILDKGRRPDGRQLDQIRPITAAIGLVPRVHGCGLFTRGETQVLTIATLGSVAEKQIIDGIGLEDSKRYMHHYNFPAYSTGEVKPQRGPGRREIGHGALAEKALLPVVPGEDQFPYTIRLSSEVLSSNGSTSMASTCASTLALMDAGVPIAAPVAGVSIGLVEEGNKSVLLTDIAGIEDFFGDMDFKVTGTRQGVTAIQLDIKNDGLTIDLVTQAMERSKQGRLSILDKMAEVISKPKEDLSTYAPRVITFLINTEKIGELIGPGGKTIKKIIAETGAKIDVEDDGRVFVTTNDGEAAKKAVDWIKSLVMEPEIGTVYTGKVVRLMNFGAFVEFLPGKDGLVHISHLADRRVGKVEDVVRVGDKVRIKVLEIDEMGRVNLTMKNIPQDNL